jgi:hypothetical protein
MVARGDESVALFLDVSEMNGPHAPPTGDHESPPNRTSSSLAPHIIDGRSSTFVKSKRSA